MIAKLRAISAFAALELEEEIVASRSFRTATEIDEKKPWTSYKRVENVSHQRRGKPLRNVVLPAQRITKSRRAMGESACWHGHDIN
jgi:hypothetical protein